MKTPAAKDFIRRRYLNKETAVCETKEIPKVYPRDWLFENKTQVEQYSQNWVEGLSESKALDFSENSLFIALPTSQYSWDPKNYPSGTALPPLLPPGDLYGFVKGN